MKKRLYDVCIEIDYLKKVLFNVWQEKGKVDQEVLNLSQQIDVLLNEYDRLLLNKSSNAEYPAPFLKRDP